MAKGGKAETDRKMPKNATHAEAWQGGNETDKMIQSSSDQKEALTCLRVSFREMSAVRVPVTKAMLTCKKGDDQALITRCSRAFNEMLTCG